MHALVHEQLELGRIGDLSLVFHRLPRIESLLLQSHCLSEPLSGFDRLLTTCVDEALPDRFAEIFVIFQLVPLPTQVGS